MGNFKWTPGVKDLIVDLKSFKKVLSVKLSMSSMLQLETSDKVKWLIIKGISIFIIGWPLIENNFIAVGHLWLVHLRSFNFKSRWYFTQISVMKAVFSLHSDI